MPEGPSILILKEKLRSFEGKKVSKAAGTAKIDMNRIGGHKIIALQSWGKHFLICFNGFFLRIHLLMFGTYRINERRQTLPRLSLSFADGEINFYTCHVLLLEGTPEEVYDMAADIMSERWDPQKALEKLEAQPTAYICDALLNQEIFSGVGNIIKNEALFLARIHPLSKAGALAPKKVKELIEQTEKYTWNFYKWKKENVLSRHFQVYDQKECPRCQIPLKKDNLGKGKRLSYYCNNCQICYITP